MALMAFLEGLMAFPMASAGFNGFSLGFNGLSNGFNGFSLGFYGFSLGFLSKPREKPLNPTKAIGKAIKTPRKAIKAIGSDFLGICLSQ
jgi:hypothetical protein